MALCMLLKCFFGQQRHYTFMHRDFSYSHLLGRIGVREPQVTIRSKLQVANTLLRRLIQILYLFIHLVHALLHFRLLLLGVKLLLLRVLALLESVMPASDSNLRLALRLRILRLFRYVTSHYSLEG